MLVPMPTILVFVMPIRTIVIIITSFTGTRIDVSVPYKLVRIFVFCHEMYVNIRASGIFAFKYYWNTYCISQCSFLSGVLCYGLVTHFILVRFLSWSSVAIRYYSFDIR